MTAAVAVEDISVHYGAAVAIAGVSLTVEAGEYAVLLGPSGCGKTTLLSVIAGFVKPSRGRVLIGGQDMTAVAAKDRPTTTVFQDYALFPHLSVVDNVAFGLRMRGVGRRERRARAEAMLALVGLPDTGGRRPHELSGGQRQRVALARALVVEPQVLLLDEPLGALDLGLRRQMQQELKAIQRRVGTTFIHVTHDQEEAMAIADLVVVMNKGQIVDHGAPRQVYLRPRSLFSAAFLGEINRIPGQGRGDRFETSLGSLPLPLFGAQTLCIRPEAIYVMDSVHPSGLMNAATTSASPTAHAPRHATTVAPLPLGPARLVEALFLGTHWRCLFAPLAAPDVGIVAHLPQGAEPKPGLEQQLIALDYVTLAGHP